MVKQYERIQSLVCIACEICECDKCNIEDISQRIVNDIRAEVIDELYNKIDEDVCDICEHKNFESDCFKTCNFEVENAKKWLLQLKENK